MARSARRTIVVLLVLSLLAVLAPIAPAAAAPLAARSVRVQQLTPLAGGTDIGSAVALPSAPGTVTGSLDALSHADDVYKLPLQAGQILTVSLNGSPAPPLTDFLVAIFRPDASGIEIDSPIDISWFGPLDGDGVGYPQVLRFVCGTSGTYYIDAVAFEGAGTYSMSYMVEEAPVDMDRLAGSDRYQTAIAVSKAGWANGEATHAVLATGLNFADALSASALAGSYGCPILLTRTSAMPTGLVDELNRLRGSKTMTVMIVGSGSAVATAVATDLTSRGFTVERFAGVDRYATALEIGKEVRRHEVDDLGHAWSGKAFVCLGTDFPDALAASPYAANMKMPVLLVKKTGVPSFTQSAVAQLGINTAYFIGGPPTIPDWVKDSVGVAAKVRLAGNDRYETAAIVAERAITEHWAESTKVGFATGRNFPDALGGGALLGKQKGTLLLSGSDWISDPGYDFVAGHASTLSWMRVFGSYVTLSDWLFSDFLYARDDGLAGP